MKKWMKPLAFALAAAALSSLAALGVTAGLGKLGDSLVRAWGVTGANLHLAPIWVQLIAGSLGTWVRAAGWLAVLALAAGFSRLGLKRKLRWGNKCLFWALAGLALGISWMALLRALDAVRWGESLLGPDFDMGMLASLLYYASSALGAQALCLGVVYQALRDLKRLAAALIASALLSLLTAPFLPIALVNAFLSGLILCALYDQTGGILAGAAFVFSRDLVLFAVAGAAGGVGHALYEAYPSGFDVLSGGGAGPMNGLVATALFSGLLAVLMRRKRDDQ